MEVCQSRREDRGENNGDDEDNINNNQVPPSPRYIFLRRTAQRTDIAKKIQVEAEKYQQMQTSGEYRIACSEASLCHREERHRNTEKDGIGEYGKNPLCKPSLCGKKEK